MSAPLVALRVEVPAEAARGGMRVRVSGELVLIVPPLLLAALRAEHDHRCPADCEHR